MADVDEALFRQAHHQMRTGDGYYRSLHDAMVTKEGMGPSNARAYRLPTLYVALAQVPDRGLRWVVAVPFAVLVLSAWRLGRPYGYQPPLHFSGRYLSAISPGDGPFGAVTGVGGGLAGAAGLVLAWRRGDEAARTAAGHIAVLAPVTVLFGRTYWAYTWGPALACFAAVSVTISSDGGRHDRRRSKLADPRRGLSP